MSKLIFSVLISVYYNESISYFKKSLDSILYQTLLPAEVVLVKDGILTDDLNCIVKEYSQKYPILKVISLPVNQGLGKALNEGLKHCSYDLVARMDTDDIAKPDRFEKQIRVFQEHPELDVVGAWIDEFEETTSNIFRVEKVDGCCATLRVLTYNAGTSTYTATNSFCTVNTDCCCSIKCLADTFVRGV